MAQHNPWPDEGNTGHIWDEDLRELDNPPPLWWMLSFYAGFIMMVFYALYYPTIPLTDGTGEYTKGMASWTQIEEYKEDFTVLKEWRTAKFADKEEKLASMSVSEILADDEMKSYAVATSKVLFGDDDWLWGGQAAQIEASIKNGRIGNMPARGMMGNLNDQEIADVADYVIALSEGKGNDDAFAAGKAVYTKGMCMACHGPAGKPLAPAGAANLTDQIWRFSSDRDEVIHVIANGVNVKKQGEYIAGTKQAVMPAFKERLPNAEVNVKRLAVYVHALGGGQ
jgi:cytochrome c oxidase cbb3-type subunit 3